MFYKKLDLKFDVQQMKQDLENSVFPLGGPLYQGTEFGFHEAFGGWSVTSYSGDWRDGWEVGHIINDETRALFIDANGQPNYKAYKYINFATTFEHRHPTQACVGEIKKVIDTVTELGMHPRRARITVLKPRTRGMLHSDGKPNQYSARLHVPIITNEQCIHVCEGIDLHMPADGHAWMLWVNRYHQIFNHSDEYRYHLIMDVHDEREYVEGYKFDGDIAALNQQADDMRKHIEAAELTPEDIALFDRAKDQYLDRHRDSIIEAMSGKKPA